MKNVWTSLWLFTAVLPLGVKSTTADSTWASTTTPAVHRPCRRLVVGIDGGTESVRACVFDAVTGAVVGRPCAVPYVTRYPHAGWAEQDPLDWWHGTGQAVRDAVASVYEATMNRAENDTNEIVWCGMAVDTTCCSVVALNAQYQPLRPCLLWMDQRAAPQTHTILERCRGDPALSVNNHGEGPISAEWMIPKALWLAHNEPDVWQHATTICDYQDYLNYQLTGTMVASACTAATRWHWDARLACGAVTSTSANPFPGRPLSLYQTLGIPELAHKLPSACLAMGERVGSLTAAAAAHLHLPVGLPVVQGGPDAFVGMIGLGCIRPGQLCLMTGSSHLHCLVTSRATSARGIWGAYRDVPVPQLHFAEGGQSSTGSLLRWARTELFDSHGNHTLSYQTLDDEASRIPPGADGLVALETFQGSRTPVTDPLARGAVVGLTLSHTRAHLWRALLEAVCFGTRACLDGLAAAGHDCHEIILAGGVSRTPMWLQLHADVTNKVISVCDNSDAPLLGCAILASVGVGVHASVEEAVASMVRIKAHIHPDAPTAARYDELYTNVYSKVAAATRPIAHAIQAMRGGGSGEGTPTHPTDVKSSIISPSLLACDWAHMEKEVHRCLEAGLHRLHVDVFDGAFLDSPWALTFGPRMVQAIRHSCDTFTRDGNEHKAVVLDLHLCVERPERFVDAMALATLSSTTSSCFIFQWEAIKDETASVHLCQSIAQADMLCGVSINPTTPVSALYAMLQTNAVHVVDILAVQPGFGGQTFQENALSKVRTLRQWRDEHGLSFDIMVDGGINAETSALVREAGATILVAGTFLFHHTQGLMRGVEELEYQVLSTR